MDTLKGQVESLRLIGGDGWGTMVVLCGSATERATVVGHPLGVEVGDTVEVEGVWAQHPRYGRQLKARAIRVVAPTDASGVIEWLRSRLPMIGRRIATMLVERYGVPGVWDVLERGDVVELSAVPGVTRERAARIFAAYATHRAERDLMVELKRFQLTDRQCARVLERFGDRALEALREDPYALAREVQGFGFVRADGVARAMGLPADHPARVRAAIEHLLEEAAGAGHVFVPAPKLAAMAARLLGLGERGEAIVRREGRTLIDAGRVVQREARLYRPELDRAERRVAESVERLLVGAGVACAGAGGGIAARKGSEAA